MEIPKLDDERVLRHVMFCGYRLLTWEAAGQMATGQQRCGYALWEPEQNEPLFCGEDFGCSPMCGLDSDEALRCLIGFLTLRSGDTDDEYFDHYTARQLEWRDQHAEELQLWGMEAGSFDNEADVPAFEDIR